MALVEDQVEDLVHGVESLDQLLGVGRIEPDVTVDQVFGGALKPFLDCFFIDMDWFTVEVDRDGTRCGAELESILNDPDLPFDRAELEVDPTLRYSELVRLVNVFASLNVKKIASASAK